MAKKQYTFFKFKYLQKQITLVLDYSSHYLYTKKPNAHTEFPINLNKL